MVRLRCPPKNKPYRRPCDDCEELFQPDGKYCRLCEECATKRMRIRVEKKRNILIAQPHNKREEDGDKQPRKNAKN